MQRDVATGLDDDRRFEPVALAFEHATSLDGWRVRDVTDAGARVDAFPIGSESRGGNARKIERVARHAHHRAGGEHRHDDVGAHLGDELVVEVSAPDDVQLAHAFGEPPTEPCGTAIDERAAEDDDAEWARAGRIVVVDDVGTGLKARVVEPPGELGMTNESVRVAPPRARARAVPRAVRETERAAPGSSRRRRAHARAASVRGAHRTRARRASHRCRHRRAPAGAACRRRRARAGGGRRCRARRDARRAHRDGRSRRRRAPTPARPAARPTRSVQAARRPPSSPNCSRSSRT